MGLDRLLARGAQLWPERTAAVIDGQACTYGQLDAAARRVAGHLQAAGIQPGERVALLTGTCIPFLHALFGIARAGAVPVLLNSWLGPGELKGIAGDAACRLLICDPEHADLAAAAAPGATRWLAGMDPGPVPHLALPVPEAMGDATDGLQLYTSGTTGTPKGVVLSQAGVAMAAVAGAFEKELRPDDRLLHSAPLFFSGTLLMLAAFMAAGASVEFQPRFDPERTWQRLARQDITVLSGVPTMLYALLECTPPAGARFTPRLVNYGGAPMSSDLLERVLAQWGCAFWQGYGLTETAVSITGLRPTDHVAARRRPQWLRSVGKPLVHVQMRVVSPAGGDVAPGEEGEIIVRGPSVMTGYWRRPEATAEALRGGWLHTGDLGTVDELGYLYILGRRSETIISGGVNIYPGEVEDVLRQHRAVRDCAVLGMPDGRWGEMVTAVIVARQAGSEALAAELQEYCRQSLARFKVPKRVEFVPALPLNASGKVQKKKLREQLLAASRGAAGEEEGDRVGLA